jgi:hypothetical protein
MISKLMVFGNGGQSRNKNSNKEYPEYSEDY